METATNISGVRLFDRIDSDIEFIELAASLGNTISLESGGKIKVLKVVAEKDAKLNTLSSRHGTGIFPFHTDTSFWAEPARLVILRAVAGDLSRSTYVKSFTSLFKGIPEDLIRQSAWVCDTGKRKFYTTISSDTDAGEIYRFDPNCIRPVNAAAKHVDQIIRPRCFDLNSEKIHWLKNRVAVISNWTHLHARGLSSCADIDRTIQRIYIK